MLLADERRASNTMTTPYASLFRYLATHITNDNWIQRHTIKWEGGVCRMCVHSHLQAQINPRVASNLTPYNQELYPAIKAAADAKVSGFWHREVHELWKRRPKNPLLDPHYLLGIVGLTAYFNDHQGTNLRKIRGKLLAAEQLAQTLGV